MKNTPNDCRGVLSNDKESLGMFIDAMREFDSFFCELLPGGKEFTLRLEVRGEGGKLLHARVSRDKFVKPRRKG